MRLRLTEKQLDGVRSHRPSVDAAIVERFDGGAWIDTDHAGWHSAPKPAAVRKSSVPPKPVHPVPRERWPAWARALALMSVPEDKGLGSTAERLAGASGMKLKVWLKSKGFDCGCSARRELWDQQYPVP